MNENWNDIEGYEGLYQVSDRGQVRSLNYNHTGLPKILKPGKDKLGRLKVMLYKAGKGKQFKVHRLVANAFLPNPLNLPCVNHRDENPSNNVVSNLEFCTQKYNTCYGTGLKRMAAKKSKSVLQYDKDGNFIRKWPSTQEVKRQLGFNQSNICQCCLGKKTVC